MAGKSVPRIGIGILVLVLWCLTPAFSGQDTAINIPGRICLGITQTPDQSQAVSWRTDRPAQNPRAEIMPLADFIHQKETGTVIPAARSVRADLPGSGTACHHHLTFTRLKPATGYVYRVGSDHGFSEWNRFTTAPQNQAPFSFLYFGDVQNEILSKCAIVFHTAARTRPEAVFWTIAGDLVNDGRDDAQWQELFTALGRTPRSLSLAPVAGNHEYPDPRIVPKEMRTLTPLWQAHFNLPPNGPKGLDQSCYFFTYQTLLFVVLNGNEKLETQARWLETVLEKNRLPWVIVSFHQPVYATSKRRDRTRYQEIFVPVLDKFGVDLVLTGHHHAYTRTFPLKNHEPVKETEKGTVYLMSVTGPKTYPVSPRYAHLFAKASHGRQLFQSIQVEQEKMTVQTFDLSGNVFDQVEIRP